jgi:arabinofuranan 3-O-arabinosyltransferase
VRRLRLAAVMLGLALLVFSQSAGNTEADTKLDLVVTPWRFLGRALHLWDPIGGAGQLQDQAYGYLFPIGPFFGALHAIDIPAWEIQRAWQTCLVVGAFAGCYLLSGHFGVVGFWQRVAAGLCYALSPRMISELSTISAELMPVAALPWVLLPLVKGSRAGSTRRAAAASGIALLFAGGVNAAATLAILPAPGLWLLTRQRGSRRASLLRWWSLAVGMSCLWWAAPLVLLGSYSPPFLDWIESASVTTAPVSLSAGVRGVDQWQSFLGPNGWPGAWILASAPAAILATTLVAAIGLAGLSVRRLRHRSFLWATLLLGLVLLTFGHLAAVGPAFGGTEQRWLDGALVAFRNVHKFDPLVRLPIALGVGIAAQRVPAPRWWQPAVGRYRLALPVRAIAIGALAVIGAVAISPMLGDRSAVSARSTTEAGWWVQAADWLHREASDSRALVVPGSSSPVYLWGGTVDAAMQPVAESPWTVRGAVPLAQAGYVRLLDSVTEVLSEGRGDPALASLLSRSGIGYLVVANDMDTRLSQAAPLAMIRATIESSPGIAPAASFGPVPDVATDPHRLVDGSPDSARPPVQIYRVATSDTPQAAASVSSSSDNRVALEPLASAVLSNGSSDTLLQLVRAGLQPATPVFFGADGAAAGTTSAGSAFVLTDGIRKQQTTFANAFTRSPTMTAEQPYAGRRAAYDYLPDGATPLSVMSYTGIADVTASSSGADLSAYRNRSVSNQPFAALDGDANTAWRSGAATGAVGQWLQVDLPAARAVDGLTVAFANAGGGLPSRVVVRTDTGVAVDAVRPVTSPQPLRVPGGATRTVRLTISAVVGGGYGIAASISEVHIPGVDPQRSLQIPGDWSASGFDFAASPGGRGNCLTVSDRPLCDPGYAAAGEEDAGLSRTFTLSQPRTYPVSAQLVIQAGTALEGAMTAGAGWQVSASSTMPGDPALMPASVIDGDPGTSWQAAPGDREPAVTLRADHPMTVRGITIAVDPAAHAGQPVSVAVRAGSEQWQGNVPASGRIVFSRPVRSSSITVRITQASLVQNNNTLNFSQSLLPVAISELRPDVVGAAARVPGVPPTVTIGCGAGLYLSVDGVRIPMTVTAPRAALLDSQPVNAETCGRRSVSLAAGRHTLSVPATAIARAVSLRGGDLSRLTTLPEGGLPTTTVTKWGDTDRRVAVTAPHAAVLVVHENANKGWRASLEGTALASVRVDGWQQGFLIPAGAHGVVHLVYRPQRLLTAGLVTGFLAALTLIAIALLPARRPVTAHRPLRDGVLPRWAVFVAVSLAAGMLAGWWGPAAVAAISVLMMVLCSLGGRLPIWAPGALLVAAALIQVEASRLLTFAAANSAGAQLLCVAALVAGSLGPVWPDSISGIVTGRRRPSRHGRGREA